MAHPGTYTNSPTLGVTGLVPGDPDTAVTFNPASNQYVVQNDTIAAQTFTAFTIGGIIKPANPTDANQPNWWGIESALLSELTLFTNKLTGSNGFIFASGAGGPVGSATILGSTAMSAGTAYRVIGTWDGVTATLYVNGAVDGTQAYAGSWVLDSAVNFYAATDQFDTTGNFSFNGTLDELFFIANHALTTGEVATVDAAMAGGGSLAATINSFSPYIYWRLGESGGTTAFDSASSGPPPPSGHTFTPPTELTVPNVAFDQPAIANALGKYYPVRPRGRAVWQIPGDPTLGTSYTFNQPYPWVTPDDVAQGRLFSTNPPRYPLGASDSNLDTQTIVRTFYGGSTYAVTPAEVTGLTAFLTLNNYTPGDWIT